MLANEGATARPMDLLHLTDGLLLHLAVCSAATFGVADVLADGQRHTAEIASRLGLNEDAVYRTLRYLAGRGVFRQTASRTFANNELSGWLRTGVPGSVRSILIFRGSRQFLAPLVDLPRAIRTGKPAHSGFEEAHGEESRLFDDAMTEISAVWASAVANSYDFGEYGSLMDLGGGSGFLLGNILRTHRTLHGVLVDRPDVLDRARAQPFWDGLSDRVKFEAADFLDSVPTGCRACVMKNVLHDWDDARALRILLNCRRAIPDKGVLLLVEYSLGAENTPSLGKMLDVVMMACMGGKERTVDEHRALLTQAGFLLRRVIPLDCDVAILEATPSAD